MGFLDKLLGRAKGTAREVAEQAEDLAGQAREAAADLAEKHGDAVTGAVDRAAEFVDEKTGGRLSGVTDTVSDAAHGAVDAIKGDAEPAEGEAASDEAAPPPASA
jgi:hypothetical protein